MFVFALGAIRRASGLPVGSANLNNRSGGPGAAAQAVSNRQITELGRKCRPALSFGGWSCWFVGYQGFTAFRTWRLKPELVLSFNQTVSGCVVDVPGFLLNEEGERVIDAAVEVPSRYLRLKVYNKTERPLKGSSSLLICDFGGR